jgi:aminotransferase
MTTIIPAERMNALPNQFFSRLVRKANEEIAKGHDVINLGQGNPDQPTPEHIVKSLQEAAANPAFHRYPPFSGFPFLKEAVAHRYKEDYGVNLDPETEVAVLFGGKTGLIEIAQILLNPGDVCLVPDPGYPDYWSGIALAGGRMAFMPLTQQNGFLPDYAALSERDKQDAKLMFINYPNNPTGVTAPEDFYQDTVRFAEQHNIVVVSDFAYGAIGFDGRKPISYLQIPGAKETGIEIYTLSKTYNMAGWRVGFAVGNREVIALINKIQDHYYCSLFGGIQQAAATALTGPQDCVSRLVALYERRRNRLFEALSKAGWQAVPSEGSFFCWLPVPKGMGSEEFADRVLREAKVVLAPGIGFGDHGQGYVRLGLLTDEDRLAEAVERIARLGLWE